MTAISGWLRSGRPNRGEASTDLLLQHPNLSSFRPVDVPVQVTTVFQSRWLRVRQREGKRILDHVPYGCNVIAHSLGGLFTGWSMKLGARFRCAFFLAPAMSRFWTFPPLGAKYIWIFHSRSDFAIRAGEALLAHPFGPMGRLGYATLDDPRVVNIETTLGHMDYFKPPVIDRLARWIEKRLIDPSTYFSEDKVGIIHEELEGIIV